jgi:4-alpha-glucanotransferase
MISPPQSRSRRAGLLVPLFSMPSSRSWGVGEIADIEPVARWLKDAGLQVLQLLPINEMPANETSPYSAMSAMAIDPLYIALNELEDFGAIGGEQGLEPELRDRLQAVRSSPGVDYQGVRTLKQIVLRRSFEHFRETELAAQSLRALAFDLFVTQEAWWLDDYALFRVLHARHVERPWTEWPEPFRAREFHTLDAASHELADDILYRQYLQWVAAEQWREARARAGGVALFGDLPFMVSADSADVWSRQDEFRLDASVGVPPDAFSAVGQDWKLPVYRWEVVASGNFDWLRARARRYAQLFDGYRVDHVVGFYRTFFRPHDGSPPQFTPFYELAQTAQGERVLAVLSEPGAEIVAEDLGPVPDFVRESLARMSIPGCKVFRWERQWRLPGQPFTNPLDYPVVSVATSGTHDTEPMAIWWDNAPLEEKRAGLDIPFVRGRLTDEDRAHALERPSMPVAVRQALLEVLYASSSNLLILPIQDVFGWRNRINRPAVVSDENWTWRLPWLVDQLDEQPEAVTVANQLGEWSERHGRNVL